MDYTDSEDGLQDEPNDSGAEATDENLRPNVLCFVMDQLRWDHLGCFGNRVIKTPNIDKLAAGGVVFDRAYVANPLCMPARASLFTGMTPRSHGVRTNGISLSPEVPTITRALMESGYHTHLAGKLHLSCFGATEEADRSPEKYPEDHTLWESGRIASLPEGCYGLKSADVVDGHVDYVFGDYINWIKREHPEHLPAVRGEEKLEDCADNFGGEHGFKYSLPEELHYNRYIADRTCDFLKKRSEDKTPFFCWTSFPDPHHPYAAPKPYCDMYDPKDMPLPTRREGELDDLPPFYDVMYEEGAGRWGMLSGRVGATDKTDDELRGIMAMTYGMVSCVDAAIGRVMEELQSSGLAENTIVFFLTDHGDMMGDHWMLNKGPFHFEGLVRMPFICSCPKKFSSGVRTSGLCSQIDFAPTVLELCGVEPFEGDVPKEKVAKCQRPPLVGKSLVPVLKGQEKKVRDWVIIENDEDYLGTNVRTFITNRYKITIYSGHEDWGELFDLKEDPKEVNNLWAKPEFKRLKEALLAKFMHSYIEEDSALPRRMSHA